MILGIDIGNTHIVFGCIAENKVLEPVLRIPTDRRETEFGYAIKLKEILELGGIDVKGFEGAVISSVVPAVTLVMKRAVELIAGCQSLVVSPGIKTGVKIGIDDPGTLAADLIATAVGAAAFYKLPCAIVDMGTATTITMVDQSNTYLGGAIFPGVATSLNALTRDTSLLPGIEISAPEQPVARNTVDSMRSGIVYGTAGAIDGILDAFEKEEGPLSSIVCTGGLGHLLKVYCHHQFILDETLLLKGLGVIWRKNKLAFSGNRRIHT